MPEEYRVYDFKPRTDWKNTAIKIAGGFLVIFFLWVLLNGLPSVLNTLYKQIVTIPIFIISLTLHEMGHAYMANYLGDPTPRLMGRLSFNPLKHLDIWGTLLFIFCGFGWAKPVQVEARNFKNPNRDMVNVALAGPLTNILIAIISCILFKIALMSFGNGLVTVYMFAICNYTVLINVMLTIFNMIPLPPLDGSRLILYILPARYRATYYRLQQYSIFIFLFLFMYAGRLIAPASSYITDIIVNTFI